MTQEMRTYRRMSVLKTTVLVSLSCHRAYQVGRKTASTWALSGCSPVACAENDMHLRQIADDTARDVQHQRRSAPRKMTRILRIDSSHSRCPILICDVH
jgi:hypothetical protein